MTGKEWIEIFKEINGRVPSSQEYQEAIKNGEIEAAKPVAITPVKPEPIEEVVKEEPIKFDTKDYHDDSITIDEDMWEN